LCPNAGQRKLEGVACEATECELGLFRDGLGLSTPGVCATWIELGEACDPLDHRACAPSYSEDEGAIGRWCDPAQGRCVEGEEATVCGALNNPSVWR
jgi:hypothetical protein